MDILSRLDDGALDLARAAGMLAEARKEKAYVVGGPVRDLVLKTPVLDLDIVLEGRAMEAAKQFAAVHKGKVVCYHGFGTATVALSGGRMVDFVTARKETYPKPGAFPVVKPSVMKDDLFRRDFTVNAMAVSINPKTWGTMVDLYGGMADLKEKKIRVLHDKSFIDDPTRILRAARFAGRFGFSIERHTLGLLNTAVKGGAMDTVKGQRFAKEMAKINKEKNKDEIVERLVLWGALPRGV